MKSLEKYQLHNSLGYAPNADRWDDEDSESEQENFKALSREEAHALSIRHGSQPVAWTLWRVLVWQFFAGLLLALGASVLFEANVAWSTLYGAFCTVMPVAIFIRGFGRQQALHQRKGIISAGAAMGSFFVWEFVKIVLTVAMLLAAPRIVVQLNWLALLAGFVVTMKVYWVAALISTGRKSQIKK